MAAAPCWPPLVRCLRGAPLPDPAGEQRGAARPAIADQFQCDDATVRRALKACNARGLAALQRGSSRPHRTRAPLSDAALARLEQLVRQSPRLHGYETRVWSLKQLADVAYAEGLTAIRVSDEPIRSALKRLGSAGAGPSPGAPAPIRPTSKKPPARPPDPAGAAPSRLGLGFADETWGRRLAQPQLHACGAANDRLRLIAPTRPLDDPDPKALAADGTRALLLIWDNAAWHRSKAVRTWVTAHNRRVKVGATGVQIVRVPADPAPLAQSDRAALDAWHAPGSGS